MAKLMTAAETRAAMKKWHVQYREYPGWTTRTRPGDTGQRNGIVLHHTGSWSQSDDYLYFLFVKGRPEDGIPGPLCNVSTDMDGDLWLGAAGRANHAGAGSGTVLAHVKAEDYNGYDTELDPGPDTIDGNDWYYGNEIRFDGAKPMSRAAWVTAVLYCAAICDFYGWSALSVIGHKEHTRRKNDPGSTLLNMVRRDVRAALTAGPGNWPEPPKEPPVSTSESETAAAGRYSDLKNTMTQWAEEKDNARQLEIKGLLDDHQAQLIEKIDQLIAVVQALVPKV
jgi:hypothetical protein